MQHSLGSVPGWQEAASSPSSSPSTGARCDGFCRLIAVGGGLLPTTDATQGRRYLVLRGDKPLLEL